MERMTIKVLTRNEVVEVISEEQNEVARLENVKRTPFDDFRYTERKKHIAKLQGILNRFPEDSVFYLHAGKPVNITEK